MAQRRLVLVRKDRVGHGLEQRHETKRFRLSASVPGETVRPWLENHAATRCTGRKQAQCSNKKRAQKLVP